MALLNRDKDPSEQKDVVYWSSQGLSFGATYAVGSGVGTVPVGNTLMMSGPIPYAFTLQSVNAFNQGASGAPQMSFNLLRTVNGGGQTMIAVSISSMVIPNGASFMTAFGYSGTLAGGYSGLAATGSTLLLGQPGDILSGTTVTANTASTNLNVVWVLKKIQDVVTMVSNAS